jgi:dihydropteroate synthase
LGRESIFPRDRVTIVGVLNVTPDSFSDGGRFVDPREQVDLAAAVSAAERLVAAGAHVLDVGGESTRPGAAEVPIQVEINRTQPVIEVLAQRIDVPISIDTRKAEVARAALTAGARIVNDISGLRRDPSIATLCASAEATLILGHMRGIPENMQVAPHYEDVLIEVARELAHSVELALAAGVAREQLVIDPGIGFGKRLEDNLRLIAHAGWLRQQLDLPVLIGHSRKSFLGKITGDRVDEREVATTAASGVAAFAGADALRVHDVASALQAAAVGRALREARKKELS